MAMVIQGSDTKALGATRRHHAQRNSIGQTGSKCAVKCRRDTGSIDDAEARHLLTRVRKMLLRVSATYSVWHYYAAKPIPGFRSRTA